jgi:hypothetical protein
MGIVDFLSEWTAVSNFFFKKYWCGLMPNVLLKLLKK